MGWFRSNWDRPADWLLGDNMSAIGDKMMVMNYISECHSKNVYHAIAI